MGHSVVFRFGPGNQLEGDICLVHVDLTVVPDEYLEYASRYPKTINGSVRDIHKSAVSQAVLGENDPWDGPVIVKTDLNTGGWPETLAHSSPASLVFHKAQRYLGLLGASRLRNTDYPVFPSAAEVPRELAEDSRLVIEKFIRPVDGGPYSVIFYKFLGDSFHCHQLWARMPVITGHDVVRRETVQPHPDIVRRRQELGLDFGKIDYCLLDGEAVMIDANKTPGRAASPPNEREIEEFDQRALGIDTFLS